MLSVNRKGVLCMVAASFFWSFGGVCIKFIPWGPMSIVGTRALFAAMVFIIYQKGVKINFTLGNIFAAICLSATTILFVFANKLTYAANAILLQFSAPVFIILIYLAFYKKKPALSEAAAVTITVLGMLLFFAGSPEASAQASSPALGNVIAILSGLSFAGVFVCNKRPDTNSEQALLLGFIINAVIGLPFVFFEAAASLPVWGAAIFLGVVQVGLAYVFFAVGIKKTPALLACLITALEPVLNPIWVVLATGEAPGPFSVAGGALIVSTVVCYNLWLERRAIAAARAK